MPAEVVTTWGVVLEIDEVAPVQSLVAVSLSRQAAGWFQTARRAYFDRCPRLTALLREHDAGLVFSAEEIAFVESAPYDGSVTAAVSVTEIRRSSFDMALRIRLAGDSEVSPISGRCTVTLVRKADGAIIPLPGEIRDEFIALQLGATAWL